MQHLSFQHGDVQGRNSAAQYAESPRSNYDDAHRDCDDGRPSGNDHSAAQYKFVAAARRSKAIKHAQRLNKTEPHGSRQRLRHLPQRRRRDR
jgi:hypothetical protein